MTVEKGAILGDFDGNFTYNNHSYYEAFSEQMAKICGIDPYSVQHMMREAGKKVLADFGNYGWEINGIIVAPPSDIILFTQSCAKIVIQQLRAEKYKNIPYVDEVDDFLKQLYKCTYPRTPVLFKPDAIDALKRLNESQRFVVVTNSSTGHVRYCINALMGNNNNIQVVGDAQKFSVTPNEMPQHIPKALRIPGLERPVYLRRDKYLGVLSRLSPIAAVFGDIGELELFLPNWLGIGTALVTSAYTPHWERNWFSKVNHSCVVDSLTEAVDFVLKSENEAIHLK